MIDFLVIDDEKFVTIGIKKMLEKEGYRARVFNTIEGALNYVRSGGEVDIVISDINMAGDNGLDMCEEIKKLRDVEIIIISGYQSFEYARKSIDLQVIEYVLKPINQKAFLETIEKTVAKVQEKRLQIGSNESICEKLLSKAVINLANGVRIDESEKELIRNSVHSKNICCMLIYFFNDELINVRLEIEKHARECMRELHISLISFCEFQKNKIICIAESDDFVFDEFKKEMELYLSENEYTERLLMIFSPIFSNPDQLDYYVGTTMIQLHEALMRSDYDVSSGHIGISVEKSPDNIPVSRFFYYVTLFVNSIIMVENTIPKYAAKLFEEFAALKLKEAKIKENCCNLLLSVWYECKNFAPIDESIISNQREGIMNYFGTAIGLQQRFVNVLTDIQKIRVEYSKNKKKNIKQSIDILLERNCAKVTLQSAAEYVELTPAYFSKVFKDQTGENFKDYVLKAKMKKAALLLLGTKEKIGDISKELGYYDTDYFTQLFKQEYMVSPSDYREQNNQ